MEYFLLSSFSVMSLLMMMTAALFAIGLWRSAGKADYKTWLIINLLALLFWHGMGFFSSGLHPDLRELTYRYTNTLFNVGVILSGVSFIQVAYLFPVSVFPSERKWVLKITVGIGTLHLSSIIWFHFIQDQTGLSSVTYGPFVNTLAGLFSIFFQALTLVVLLRKSRYFHTHNSASRIPTLLMAISPIGFLIISMLLIYPGASHMWVMQIYSIGFWVLIQKQMLIYSIYSTFPIRFRDKLVAFTFASVMCMLSVIIIVIVPFTTNSIDSVNITQRIAGQPTLIRLLWIAIGLAAFVVGAIQIVATLPLRS